jgi:formate dehydrogenase subunit delta
MNTEHLVEMANDIATYFAFESRHDEAVDSVATHLRKYWEPRMRKEIVAYLAAGGGGLDPLARDAVVRIGELDGNKAA